MDKQESRRQFEGWVSLLYSGSNLLLRVGPNKESYHQTIVEGLWMAWQASRAAIVVELPEMVDFELLDESQVRDSLRAAGLSIKGE